MQYKQSEINKTNNHIMLSEIIQTYNLEVID